MIRVGVPHSCKSTITTTTTNKQKQQQKLVFVNYDILQIIRSCQVIISLRILVPEVCCRNVIRQPLQLRVLCQLTGSTALTPFLLLSATPYLCIQYCTGMGPVCVFLNRLLLCSIHTTTPFGQTCITHGAKQIKVLVSSHPVKI